MPDSVHGRIYHASGQRTSVGQAYTWVAEKDTPFKLMYTGWEARNIRLETEYGVPSGSGWHVMGETITLINYEESVPFLVGAGFSDPSERVGLKLPEGDFVYGLSDIAVFRLLFPGEVFVTVDYENNEIYQNHQWYAIHTNHHFLAEEWVSPVRPIGDNPLFQ